jgi:hypothetical protein
MPEALVLTEKFKMGVEDKTVEISALEEKYRIISSQIAGKLLELENELVKASKSLNQVSTRALL